MDEPPSDEISPRNLLDSALVEDNGGAGPSEEFLESALKAARGGFLSDGKM